MLDWYMIFFLPLLFLISCGPSNNLEKVKRDGVVVGPLDWIEVSDELSPKILTNSKAVANLYIPSNHSRCTGFLISNKFLMTNYHCVSNSNMAMGVTANFSQVSGDVFQDKYSCETFIYGNDRLDFSILECEEKPGERFGFLVLGNEDLDLFEKVYLIQYNCNYFENANCDFSKKISYGRIIKIQRDEIFNTTDSLMGSSGSPLIDLNSQKVIGIHHSGKATRNNQRGPYNMASPSKEIIQDLLKNQII